MAGALTGKWVGLAEGTNRGQIVIDMVESEASITGEAILSDAQFGETRFHLTASKLDGHIRAQLTDFRSSAPAVAGSGTAELNLSQDESELRGTWNSDLGASGTIHLLRYPADSEVPRAPNVTPATSFTKVESLAACVLDRESLSGLVQIVTGGISKMPLLYLRERGRFETSVGLDSFLSNTTHPATITNLRIWLGDPPNRSIDLQLTEFDGNQLTVVGNDNTWVEGRVEEVKQYLEVHRARLNDLYRKHSGKLNALILAFMLILTPQVNVLWERAAFVLLIFGILWGSFALYRRILPGTRIILRGEDRWAKYREQIYASIVATAAISLIAFVSNYFLQYWGTLQKLVRNF